MFMGMLSGRTLSVNTYSALLYIRENKMSPEILFSDRSPGSL